MVINSMTRNDNTEMLPLLGGLYFNSSVAGKKAMKLFDPTREYGVNTEMKSRNDKEAIQFLHISAKRCLPEGTPYELRMMCNGRGRIAAAWYYSPIAEIKSSTMKWKFKKKYDVYIMGPFYS